MKGGKRTGREGGHIEVYSYFFPFTQLLHMCKLSRFSCVRLFVTLWVVGSQAPLSMGFSRQEYWVAVPSSRGSPDPGIKSTSLISPVYWQVGSLPLEKPYSNILA